jgi:hypothetical protein
MEQYNLQEWAESQQNSISLEQMDSLVAALKQKRDEHTKAKEAATKIYHELEEAEKSVINALKSSGKSKYELEEVGLVYISHKETYTTPKTNEQKTELFNFIKAKHGPDALMSMVSINHQTLNSWAAKEVEADPLLTIPGLELPTATETLNFRKK